MFVFYLIEQMFVNHQETDMAIASLPQQEQFELLEIPWPKPTLRLVTKEPTVATPRSRFHHVASVSRIEVPQSQVAGPLRRSRTSAVVARRRRLVAILGVSAVLVLLALPLQVLGGKTVTGQMAPGGVTTGLPDGSVYVVRSGDTLTSIAQRMNPSGDQAALVRALRMTVGSPVVVPGEHIVLP